MFRDEQEPDDDLVISAGRLRLQGETSVTSSIRRPTSLQQQMLGSQYDTLNTEYYDGLFADKDGLGQDPWSSTPSLNDDFISTGSRSSNIGSGSSSIGHSSIYLGQNKGDYHNHHESGASPLSHNLSNPILAQRERLLRGEMQLLARGVESSGQRKSNSTSQATSPWETTEFDGADLDSFSYDIDDARGGGGGLSSTSNVGVGSVGSAGIGGLGYSALEPKEKLLGLTLGARNARRFDEDSLLGKNRKKLKKKLKKSFFYY